MSYYSAISDIIKLFFALLLFPIYSLAITEPFMDVELTFDLSPHIIGLLSGENRCKVSVREKPLEEFSLEEGVHGSNKKFYYYMHQNFCKDIRELFNSASIPSAKSMWKTLHSYKICFRHWPEMLESISYFEKLFQRMYNHDCLAQGILTLDCMPSWMLCTQLMRNNAPPKFHEIPYQMAVRIEQPANKKYANSSVVREQYCDLELVEPLSYLLTAQVQKHYDGNEEITYEVPIMTDCYPPDFGNTLIKAFNQNSRENEHHILLIIPEVFAQSSVDLHEENTVVIKVQAEHDDHAEYALEDIKLPIVVEESHKSPVAIAKAEKEKESMDVETLDSGLGLDEVNEGDYAKSYGFNDAVFC